VRAVARLVGISWNGKIVGFKVALKQLSDGEVLMGFGSRFVELQRRRHDG